MRPRLSTITTSVSLFVVSVAASTFIEQLPGCWQTCIEKRGPQCEDSDLDCLCHHAATPTLFFPSLLPCVRQTCDSEYYPQFLTAPLRTIQTACAATRYSISDIAVSKAVHAAEGAYSAAVDAGRERGRSATRTRGMKSRHLNAGSTTSAVSMSSAVSSTGDGMVSSTTASTPASSPVSSIAPTTGIPTVSTIPPKRVSISSAAISTAQELASSTTTSTPALFSVSSIDPPTAAPILSTPAITSTQSSAFSRSTSSPHDSNEGGGTPLDVGQQGVGVEKRAGSLLGSSLLGLLAIAFVPMVFF